MSPTDMLILHGNGHAEPSVHKLLLSGGWRYVGEGRYAYSASPATVQEPPPRNTAGESVQQMVIRDMIEREKFGIAKYGQPVQAGCGRDTLVDAYQEALDLAVYLRKAIAERDVPG